MVVFLCVAGDRRDDTFLIHTSLQRGATLKKFAHSRLTAFVLETVETVSKFYCTANTSLKRGVNETVEPTTTARCYDSKKIDAIN